MPTQVKATTADAYNLLHKGILAFARAERQGIHIDVDYCKRQHAFLTRKIGRLENEVKRSNFYRKWEKVSKGAPNIYSNPQLAALLYKVMKIEPLKMTEGGKTGATDEESLQQLNIPELNKILSIRKLKKIKGTYLENYLREQVSGIVHPSINLHTAVTYRSSMDSPNIQNVPKRDKEAMNIVRRAIIPSLGHLLLEIDYSGIEVKISVCYHLDPNMMEYVRNPTTDMHRDMMKQLFMFDLYGSKVAAHKHLRDGTKNGFVFPQFYGDYYGNCVLGLCKWGELPRTKWKKGQGIKLPNGHLSDHLIANGIKSYDMFMEHIKKVEADFWGRRFKVYSKWKDRWHRQYQRKGHMDMLTGFRCSGAMSRNEVINRPIQGTAFHCLLQSFIDLDRIQEEEGWRSKLIAQIHDSLIIDTHPDELEYVAERVRQVTCENLPKKWKWIIVPLEVEADVCGVDEPWSEKRPYKLAA